MELADRILGAVADIGRRELRSVAHCKGSVPLQVWRLLLSQHAHMRTCIEYCRWSSDHATGLDLSHLHREEK